MRRLRLAFRGIIPHYHGSLAGPAISQVVSPYRNCVHELVDGTRLVVANTVPNTVASVLFELTWTWPAQVWNLVACASNS